MIRRLATATLLALPGLLVPAAPADADAVILKSGKVVAGRIAAEDEKGVMVEAADGDVRCAWSEIEDVLDGEEILDEYRERHAAAPAADTEAQLALAAWLADVGLVVESRARLRAILEREPDQAAARERLGYVRERGRWVHPVEESAARGERRGPAASLPLPVRADLRRLADEDAATRRLALRRLRCEVEGRRAHLRRALSRPDDPDRAAVLAAVGDAAPSVADAQRVADEHLAGTLVAPLVEVLGDRRKEAAKRFESRLSTVRGILRDALASRESRSRRRMLAAVEAARKAFLETIEADGFITNKAVDERRRALAGVWKPLDDLVEAQLAELLALTPEGAAEALERVDGAAASLDGIEGLLAELGAKAGDPPPALEPLARCLLEHRAGMIGSANEIAASGLSDWGTLLHHRMRDLRVLEANRELAGQSLEEGEAPNEHELEQSEILNEYRMMLGRDVLEVHPQLTEAARGHSEEMFRLGYFGHDSPTRERRTPTMRARLAGYEGAVSENIVATGGIPSAHAAHLSWLGSLPHHRNMISAQWGCVGVGQHSGNFTQNFGTMRRRER